MNAFVFVFMICVLLQPSEQQNENERINDGASTSRQDLDRCENCNIENCAMRTINLMLAEDVRGDNLTHMMNHRFDELEEFFNEIISNFMLAKYSTADMLNAARQDSRFEYFLAYLRGTVQEIFYNVCEEHFYFKIWYEYDSQRRMIFVREHVRTNDNSNDCLCGNHQERMILYEPFVIPNFTFPDKIYQFNSNINEVSVFNTSSYHIIPLCLLQKFFEVWQTQKITSFIKKQTDA